MVRGASRSQNQTERDLELAGGAEGGARIHSQLQCYFLVKKKKIIMLRCAFVYFCLGVLLCLGFDSVCGSVCV